jgi:hypothetical protein
LLLYLLAGIFHFVVFIAGHQRVKYGYSRGTSKSGMKATMHEKIVNPRNIVKSSPNVVIQQILFFFLIMVRGCFGRVG